LVEGNGWDHYGIANPDKLNDYVQHDLPMGRLGTRGEMADVVVFIASLRAHWTNGRNVAVDGLEQPHAPIGPRPFFVGTRLPT
jgi:3-oxoacyl-[acyl-carrier protein] reductase